MSRIYQYFSHEELQDKLEEAVSRVAELEAVALNALYHHQGAGSAVGQPIRRALGIGQFDRLAPAQIETAHSVPGTGHE